MSDKLDEILDSFNNSFHSDPVVFLFTKESEQLFYNCLNMLKENGFNLIDVNQELVINPDDYNILISEVGFNGPTGKETINDVQISDEEKRRWIVKAKINSIEKGLNKKSVLVIKYNQQIINNHSLYETLRSLLKDGVQSLRSIRSIVQLETTDKIRDFCYYGFYI